MRSFLLPLVLFAFSGLSQTAVLSQTLHAIIQRAHEGGNFDGVVVVSRDGPVVYKEAFGLADRAHAVPMRVETVFHLASLTKQVTALLVMQEVRAKHLSLNEFAQNVLPGLAPTTGRVTILQLLQHVSGLPNPSDGPENIVPEFYLRSGRDAPNNTKSALGFCSGAAKREPGLQFEYNNCDYLVLGALLEKVTGKSYATLVQERVINPLGLKSWGVAPADPSVAPHIAVGYAAD